ncbi:Fe-S cluster assembly iron-binding protein IscA [Bradyrhizobium japonicum]
MMTGLTEAKLDETAIRRGSARWSAVPRAHEDLVGTAIDIVMALEGSESTWENPDENSSC